MNEDLLVSVLKRASQRGATAADGYLVEESRFGASVRMGEIETLSHSREQRLALRVFAGRASAAASTSDLSRESLERVVDEATALARITAEDPHAGLPEPSALIERVPDLDLEDSGADLSPEEKIEIARRAEAAALESDPRITNSEGAEYSDRRAHYAYATSHGSRHGAGQRGDADRERPRGSHARLACWSRPAARRGCWDVRQGRPVRAGGRRAPDDPHRRHHRRRNGRMKPGVSEPHAPFSGHPRSRARGGRHG